MKFVFPLAAGSAGVTNWVWLPWLPLVWQIFVGALGAEVLAMTLWNKILENKQRRRDLNKPGR
jgi:membrane protein implicated in regulation of membrane protease activity